MLKNIIRKDLGNLYTGFSWKNNNIPQVDVFFIISKNTINILKKILCTIGNKKKYTHTHSIYRYLDKTKFDCIQYGPIMKINQQVFLIKNTLMI